MAQAITLKYQVKFTLNTDPMTLSFEDLLASLYNTVYGMTLADVLGILKITGPNGVLHKNAGWDTDDYSSPDIDGGTPDWILSGVEVPLNDAGVPYPGTYIVEIKMSFNGGTETSITDTYTLSYDYVSPVATVGIASDCKYSTLTVDDDTPYTVTHGGESFDPINTLTTDRDITIRYPLSAGDPPGSIANVLSHLAQVVIGPNIWTGTFDVYLTTDLIYELELWSDGDAKLVVIDTIMGEQDHTVTCDECSCAFYDCIKQVDDRYQQALYQDFTEADRLLRLRSDINFYWGLYQMAIRCDKETGWICSKLQTLVNSENCQCGSASSTASVEIIPWSQMGGGGVGGTVNQWYSGSGVPNVALGIDGDFYLRTTNGDVYKKSGGTWSVIMNITGAAGADGESGFSVLSTSFGQPSASYGSNSVAPVKLAEHVIDNTPTEVITNNFDTVRITADCYMHNKPTGNGAGFYITVNGVELIRVFADHETANSKQGLVRMEVEIMRQTNKSFHIRVLGVVGGQNGFNNAKMWTIVSQSIRSMDDWTIQLYAYCKDSNKTDGATFDTTFKFWNMQVIYIPAKVVTVPVDQSGTSFIHQEVFTAEVDQVQFDVTGFSLNNAVLIFVDSVITVTGFTRSGNSIIFDTPMTGGEQVVIVN